MKLPVEKRALAMMNAALIDGSDLSDVDDFAKKYDGKVSAKEKYKYVGRTVKERVKNFKRDNTGFSCSTDYKKGKLVWFSVPYDKGWDATLDGKKIEIIKSAGMMAVKVPKGEHNLVFKYHTPGFKLGIIVSIISFIVFGIYTAILVFKKRIN
ncbi:YfhO family protein [Ligilactobacillus ruminis]|uniref:YfhO family protein n=1 Tax=Ligilactobacillus ruminis TaxID=1623 RepID=UPI001F26ACA1|nr:YfhO family protein [Ligilactobacillus ruminis]